MPSDLTTLIKQSSSPFYLIISGWFINLVLNISNGFRMIKYVIPANDPDKIRKNMFSFILYVFFNVVFI